MTKNDCPPCAKSNPGEFLKLGPENLLLSMAFDGIIVDNDKAKEGPCECISTPSGKPMCWDKGIVGALNQDQVKEYCTDNYVEKKLPARLANRWNNFATASAECEMGKSYNGEKIQTFEDRLQCMHIEASKHP